MTSYYINFFTTNVLRQLDEQEMTKNDLAKAAKVANSFLTDITTGKGNPSLKIMERIANALNTPLPTLLEASDLDQQTRMELAGEKACLANPSLPKGHVRTSAILTDFEAFRVKQLHEKNLKQIQRESLKRRRRSRVRKEE